jgi:hypothetical protein
MAATETPQSGTKDKNYDLITVTHLCLEHVWRLDRYAQDAGGKVTRSSPRSSSACRTQPPWRGGVQAATRPAAAGRAVVTRRTGPAQRRGGGAPANVVGERLLPSRSGVVAPEARGRRDRQHR